MTDGQRTASFPLHHGTAGEPTPVSISASTSVGTPAPTDPEPAREEVFPRAFGRYELRRLLGRGGMGRVYLAHDPQLDRPVALKMPNPVEGVPSWRERFFAEARAAATLAHPNVCPVHDVGETEGQPYLTMAFVEGETLAAKLERDGPMEPTAAVSLVCTVARAIHEAHRRGIVHRDLKPANLMLDPNGRPVIMDFGLAVRATAADDLRLTVTGVVLGTPSYMPPEQAGGDHDAIGPTSDVYSLGVILYELVTGRVPFKAKSFGKLLAQIERDVPPTPSSLNPAVDPALEAIILTCLAKSPAARFDGAGDLADALDRYLAGDRFGLISRYSKPYVVPDATGESHPNSSNTTARYRNPPRRVWWVAATALVLALVAVAAGVIYVQTDYGDLKVELSEPDAKVGVRVNGQTVALTADGKVTHIKAGDGELVVTGDGYETAAKSFNLKRGDTTLVRVELVPKLKAPSPPPPPPPPPDTTPGDPSPVKKPGADSGAAVAPMPREGKPKRVPFPDKSTLIEVPGWQVLTDANKGDMEKWLKERKKDKHSVTWIDACVVGEEPVFSAVAALDDRGSDWQAYLDVPTLDFPAEITKRVKDLTKCQWTALSGYAADRKGYAAALLIHPLRNKSWVAASLNRVDLGDVDAQNKQNDYGYVSVRPSATFTGTTQFAVITGNTAGPPGIRRIDMEPAELAKFVTDQRAAGERLTTLTAYPVDDKLVFAATSAANDDKSEWSTDTNLTAAQFKSKAEERAKKGFRPSCVTAAAWDGAVRYCVVWVKEPPKPVPYPKGPTLVETAGWQILTDANKEDMEKWLDDRRKDKHSVMWLDACAVGDKPLFVGVAALDNRLGGEWQAFLDVPAVPFPTEMQQRKVNTAKVHFVALTGYVAGTKIRTAFLLHPPGGGGLIHPTVSRTDLVQLDEQIEKNGFGLRTFRPYPSFRGDTEFAVITEKSADAPGARHLDLEPDALRKLVTDQRAAGKWLTSITAYPFEDKRKFAATSAANDDKSEWSTDTDLTTAEFKSKAEERAKKGFRPSCVTAAAWDGAVRYCVVWVKEPPKKEKEPDKKP